MTDQSKPTIVLIGDSIWPARRAKTMPQLTASLPSIPAGWAVDKIFEVESAVPEYCGFFCVIRKKDPQRYIAVWSADRQGVPHKSIPEAMAAAIKNIGAYK